MLYEQLDDTILSLNHLFNNPRWGTGLKNEAAIENHDALHDGFLKGHRYFVLSSLLLKKEDIELRVKGKGRRIMYFNDLRKRYIAIYEALKDAKRKSHITSTYDKYLAFGKYEELYEAYKNMDDIK